MEGKVRAELSKIIWEAKDGTVGLGNERQAEKGTSGVRRTPLYL